MAIITFWSNGIEQTGKTMSLVAIATNMAIEHNAKILIVSTTDNETTLSNCFFKKTKDAENNNPFVQKTKNLAIDNGMMGLAKVAKSNKVTPETIRNYTRPIFKDTLEVLLSGTTEDKSGLAEYYPEVIRQANNYYDFVFVDLDSNINQTLQNQILKYSNLIVANINQKLSSVERFIEDRKNNEFIASNKTIVLIGRYDKFSRYSAKNIARYVGIRHVPITIPYNTLFYDYSEEAQIPELFLSFAKNKNMDKDDRNYTFIDEVKRAQKAIIYKIQELQMKY